MRICIVLHSTNLVFIEEWQEEKRWNKVKIIHIEEEANMWEKMFWLDEIL